VTGPHAPRIALWPDVAAEQDRLAQQAAAILRDGGVVVFPTDTVYGIAAMAGRDDAVARLYAVKGRPPSKQIALLIDDPEVMAELAEVPPVALELGRRYWPGALTLVLRGRIAGDTVAFRQPDHPVPRAVARALGWPVATTSANLSDHPSPQTAEDVLCQLSTGYELLIDGGQCPGGVDSTVVDLTGTSLKVLRRGPLDLDELLGIARQVEIV
jgi:L-threonylcarbamoyladenylate synthase